MLQTMRMAIKKKRTRDPRSIARGEKLKKRREELNLSQEEVRRALGLKSREAVAQWERGMVHEIARDYRLGLCKIYGFEERELLLDPTGEPKDFEMPLSRDAIAFAYRFDHMPEAVKTFIKTRIAETENQIRNTPDFAKTIYPDLDGAAQGRKKKT